MTESPAVSRRRLGAELRRFRIAAGRSVEEAAAQLECSQSKISRIENGRAIPKLRDVRDLIALYGEVARSDTSQLLAWAQDAQGREWLDKYRDVVQDGDLVPGHLLRYVELEQHAHLIRNFEPQLVPGIIQSDDYIMEMSKVVSPTLGARERRRLVDFRIQRRTAMSRPGQLRVELVINEVALLRNIGSRATMLGQLNYLERLLDDPEIEIDIRLLPYDLFVPDAVSGPFAIVQFSDDRDQDLVYLEGREGAVYLEKSEDVQRYIETFHRLHASAMSASDSTARIQQLLRTTLLGAPPVQQTLQSQIGDE